MPENQSKESSQQTAKKRFSPIKIALIIVGLLFFVFVVKIILLLTASPTISVDYLSQYNRLSKPENYDPNKNALPSYRKAFEVFVDIPDDISELRKVWPADMNRADFDAVKNWLALNSQALGYLKEAVQKPYYWIERYSEDNSLQKVDFSDLVRFRDPAYCLKYQSKLLASQGQIEQALECVIDLHRMGAHLAGRKTLVEQLIGIPIRGMARQIAFSILDRKTIISATLTDFQYQLEQQMHRVPQGLIYDAEKLYTYDTIQRVFADDGSGDGRLIPAKYLDFFSVSELRLRSYLGAIWISLNNPGKRQTMELTERLYELLDELGQKTPWQLHQEGISYEEQVQKLTGDNRFISFLTRYIGSIYENCQWDNAQDQTLIATVAILRYKADKGQVPENLEHLVASGYLKELPIDPYSDGPLTYKRIGDDFTLYSFGADFDDDGGVHSTWGWYREGGDQVFWPVSRKQK